MYHLMVALCDQDFDSTALWGWGLVGPVERLCVILAWTIVKLVQAVSMLGALRIWKLNEGEGPV